MGKALLAFGNKIEKGLVTGGSWTSKLSLTKIQDPILGHFARTTDVALASTVIEWAGNVPVRTRLIGLFNHQGTLDAQIRIKGSDTSNYSNLIVNTGWQKMWPAVYHTLDLDWEASNWWSGQYTLDEILSLMPQYIYILPASKYLQFIKIEIADVGNQDGFFQVGRGFIGDAIQLSNVNITNVNLGVTDDSTVEKSFGGAFFFEEKDRRRNVKFTMDGLDDDTAMKIYDVMRQSGINKEVVYVQNPDDTVHFLRRSFMGHFLDLNAIDMPLVRRVPISIEELR